MERIMQKQEIQKALGFPTELTFYHLHIERDAIEGAPRIFISSVPFDIRHEGVYKSASWHKMYKRKNRLIFATSDDYRPKTDAAIEDMITAWLNGAWQTIDLKSPSFRKKK